MAALALATERAPAARASALLDAHAGPVTSTVVDDTVRALMPTEWLFATSDDAPYVLPGADLGLLRVFRNPEHERTHPAYTFRDGRYGPKSWRTAHTLAWTSNVCSAVPATAAPTPPLARAEASLHLSPAARVLPTRLSGIDLSPLWAVDRAPAPDLGLLGASRADPCPAWKRVRPVVVVRYGGERSEFPLLGCDGSVTPEAVDYLSVMARPTDVDRPELPLPLEPDPAAADRDEWVPGVKILHPRLVWVMQQVADAFPYRIVYVISGYRDDPSGSLHHKGRALDIHVMGASNEELLEVCRELPDVGCGYYPFHDFVHFDVRPFGSGHALWVDASGPGEPSRYVDAWPGVVEGGALRWAGSH